MKLNSIAVTTIVLLVASFPRYECRAIDRLGAAAQRGGSAGDTDPQQQQTVPLLERVGEEYFIRLANGNSDSFRPGGGSPAFYSRALKLQLTRRLLEGKVGHVGALLGGFVVDRADDESMERGRRSEEPPISLDLTFHLLREMMEMSRAEQMAQQAVNNRRMMELFGKK